MAENLIATVLRRAANEAAELSDEQVSLMLDRFSTNDIEDFPRFVACPRLEACKSEGVCRNKCVLEVKA